jgi:hypothetical protein
MRKLTLALILFLSLIIASPARAQRANKFSSVEVDLWPEYDHPGILVIYRITLSSDTTLPTELTISLPASVAEPSAVAVKQVDGTLINMAYTKQITGQWNHIHFTATMPDIQIEYYDASLIKQGQARHYEYNWPGGYGVAAFSIQVQQPLGSTNMLISPRLSVGEVGQDGLTYYTAQVGSLSPSQIFKISIDYQKPNDMLSAERLQVQLSKPLDESTPGRIQLFSGMNTLLAVIGLILIGAVLIAGGGYWYWQSGRSKEAPVRYRRQQRRAGESPDESSAENEVDEEGGSSAYGGVNRIKTGENTVYCQQCGNRAGQGDRFCRLCGVKLRIE